MAALPYIQLYVADYLADTMHLTTEEHGAYLLLIMNYWQTGKPIPKKRLAAISRMMGGWKEVEPSISEFFEDDGENWIHTRIDADLQDVHTKPRGKSLPGGESLSGYRGYIYFVSSDELDKVKIGYSKNPWARLGELRRASGLSELRVVATVKTTEKSEVNIHKLVSEFHIEGEWYSKSDEVSHLVSEIKKGEVKSVEEVSASYSNYISTTVAKRAATVGVATVAATATTNTDTDTDTNTDTDTDIKTYTPPKKLDGDVSVKTKSKNITKSILVKEHGVDPQHADDYLLVRKAKTKTPLTETAFRNLCKQFEKGGLDVKTGVQKCAENGWVGFNPDWGIKQGQAKAKYTGFENIDYEAQAKAEGFNTELRI